MTTVANIPSRLGMWGALAALVLAGCASVPPPTNLMQRAHEQVDAARKAKAADFAPVDLELAKKRLQSAQQAMEAKKYGQAQDMAHEAMADGRLAQTRAELASVHRQIKTQSAANKQLRKRLAGPADAASSTSNNGLPEQITLPQPASGAPASASSSATPAAGGNR